MNWEAIAAAIEEVNGQPFRLSQHTAVGGGCINSAYRLQGSGQEYFVKFNREDRLDMFKAESAGLSELAAVDAVRVPMPVCTGIVGNQAFIVMENLDMGGSGDVALLAEQLAEMHQHTADDYGWKMQNTIGSTPQLNVWMDDWIDFFAEQRLGYQLQLAARRGAGAHLVDYGLQLVEHVGDFFGSYTPQASLLHGDLWSGNYGMLSSGEPVIFDPAVYYGDREADIAMTELFGGFSHRFYDAYNAAWRLDMGYRKRRDLYNLYHILNHFNMFGGGYGTQAEGMIHNLLSEVK